MKAERKDKIITKLAKIKIWVDDRPILKNSILFLVYPFTIYACRKAISTIKEKILKESEYINCASDANALSLEQHNSLDSNLDNYIIFCHHLHKIKLLIFRKWYVASMEPHYRFIYKYGISLNGKKMSYDLFALKIQEHLLNPQQDLMYTIKECNHYYKLRDKCRKFWRRKKRFRNEKAVLKWFSKFHKKVEKEVPDIKEFINLCNLDQQYGFCGMATINPTGSTVIDVL